MFDFIAQKFTHLFDRFTSNSFTESMLDELLPAMRQVLLDADVPYEIAERFIGEIKEKLAGQKLIKGVKPADQLMKVVYEHVLHFLGGKEIQAAFLFQQLPSVCFVMGLQGAGKTTTLVKLAAYIRKQAQKNGKKRAILLASVDFNRPAAIDQLEVLAGRAEIPFYRAQATDAYTAAQEIYRYSQKELYDILLLDTAGRLHVDDELITELEKLNSFLKPKYKILVLDSMIGQESLAVAQTFEKRVGITGAILTKVDSGTRGGVALAFKYSLNKPVLFMGTGEGIEDLEAFVPERVASRMLGQGDIASLVERIDDKIKQSDQANFTRILQGGSFSLQDFSDQLAAVKKLGSLSSLMKYLPGASKLAMSDNDIARGEKEMKKFQAIVSSMTLKERVMPQLLNGSRKQRVARGAGVSVAEVNQLLVKFEESRQYVKLLGKMRKFN